MHLSSISRSAVIALLALTVAHGSALGQSGSGEEDSSSRIQTLPPAYNDHMLRLAEILGSLHYLRPLCGSKEEQLWREQMEEMIAEEEPSEDRRVRLVARFNRGFRSLREIYRECTPSAAEAANRYVRQGIRLATEIPTRFGN